MIELTPVEKIIARLLVDSAIQKRGNYIYSELSDVLEKEYSMKVNAHYGLSIPLGNIAILCNDLSLPLLSVRVQYKNDNSGKTAEGFYNIACELKPEYKAMEPQEVRRIELERTRACTEWQRLIDCLDGQNISVPPPPLAEQYDEFTREIIAQFGVGHEITKKEIVHALIDKYGTNPKSILPADNCYNRWNQRLKWDKASYFEFIDDGRYKVYGKDYLYTGLIYANPDDDNEYVAGYYIDGKKYKGEASVYPDEIIHDSEGKPLSFERREGKQRFRLINTYERDPIARQRCINHYGATCYICTFDFGESYGAMFTGKIHVHHRKQISDTDGEYIVDPINDLVPVCPNCHMILHSKKDGYTVEEVRAMLKK